MGILIDMRKRFLWMQCGARFRRGEIKLPESRALMDELKNMIIGKDSNSEEKAKAHD